MLVLIALLLVLVPAAAILYPFYRGSATLPEAEDESSDYSVLRRQWDAAVSGLRNAELEQAIGNLNEDDYRWLRDHYLKEAAQVMRAMELEEQQEEQMLSSIEREVREVRRNLLGDDGPEAGQ